MSEVQLFGALNSAWIREHELLPRVERHVFKSGERTIAERSYLRPVPTYCFHDDPEGKLGRVFRVTVHGTTYEVAVRQSPATAAENFNHVETPPEIPSDAEVLNLVGRMFLASLPREGPALRSFSEEGRAQ
ncbi:MAG: hypothetical protein RLZZ408_138 [Verrucomicrobiota bacterium]|jgi:hypothetical protein